MGILFGGLRRSATWGVEPPILPWSQMSTTGYGGDTAVTSKTAMQTSAFWACVNLMANTVSMCTLNAYRGVDSGVPAKLSPQPQLLRKPSGSMTQSQWLREFVVSEMLTGDTFGLVTSRDGNQLPTSIRLLNPNAVQVTVDRVSGAAVYKWAVTQQVIPTYDMWHVPGLTMPGDVKGMSPVTYAATTLGINLSARRFGKDFLDGDGIPKAVIESDLNVTQAQAQTLKDRFMAASRKREPVVMGAGVHVNQVQIKPEESQFLATIQASDTEIARFCGVPPGFIGAPEGSTMTYTNVEMRSLNFLTYGVGFWLKRIEDAVSAVLPQPQYAQFDTSALLRVDEETQARVDLQYIAGRVFAPSEIRARKGFGPLTDAQSAELEFVPALTITPKGDPKALPAPKSDATQTEGTAPHA